MTYFRAEKETKGNGNRLTVEEIIEGKDEPKGDDDDPDPAEEWVKTEYIYDVTMDYAQVLQEKKQGKTTSYDYGLERIASHGDSKSVYVYDGRGSVAQEINNDKVTSKAYTPFGELIGEKQTGFGFNGEAYDSATGFINLRARQYEPALNRFSQKDILRGSMDEPISLNRYLYVNNNPISYIDPSGESLKSIAAKAASVVNKAKSSSILSKAATTVKSVVTKAKVQQRTTQINKAVENNTFAGKLYKATGVYDRINSPEFRQSPYEEQLKYYCVQDAKTAISNIKTPATIHKQSGWDRFNNWADKFYHQKIVGTDIIIEETNSMGTGTSTVVRHDGGYVFVQKNHGTINEDDGSIDIGDKMGFSLNLPFNILKASGSGYLDINLDNWKETKLGVNVNIKAEVFDDGYVYKKYGGYLGKSGLNGITGTGVTDYLIEKDEYGESHSTISASMEYDENIRTWNELIVTVIATQVAGEVAGRLLQGKGFFPNFNTSPAPNLVPAPLN